MAEGLLDEVALVHALHAGGRHGCGRVYVNVVREHPEKIGQPDDRDIAEMLELEEQARDERQVLGAGGHWLEARRRR